MVEYVENPVGCGGRDLESILPSEFPLAQFTVTTLCTLH